MRHVKLAAMGVVLGLGAPLSAASVLHYALADHPDGLLNPPAYGLRFDGIFGGGAATFSMDYYGDSTLTVHDNGSTIDIRIMGTLYGGEVDGSGGYLSADTYHLDFSYTVDVQAQADGWIAFGEHSGDAGSLIRDVGGSASLDPLDQFSLSPKMDGSGQAFAFLADGHRLPNNTDWVGRGWFEPYPGGTGSQDLLFTGTLIPAPGALGMLGFVGVVMMRRRRS